MLIIYFYLFIIYLFIIYIFIFIYIYIYILYIYTYFDLFRYASYLLSLKIFHLIFKTDHHRHHHHHHPHHHHHNHHHHHPYHHSISLNNIIGISFIFTTKTIIINILLIIIIIIIIIITITIILITTVVCDTFWFFAVGYDIIQPNSYALILHEIAVCASVHVWLRHFAKTTLTPSACCRNRSLVHAHKRTLQKRYTYLGYHDEARLYTHLPYFEKFFYWLTSDVRFSASQLMRIFEMVTSREMSLLICLFTFIRWIMDLIFRLSEKCQI